MKAEDYELMRLSWYEKTGPLHRITVGLFIFDIIATILCYPDLFYMPILVAVIFVFSFPLGFRFWLLVRYRLAKGFDIRFSQKSAVGFGLGSTVFFTTLFLLLSFLRLLPFWALLFLPLLQGFALMLARLTPMHYKHLFEETERTELVEALDAMVTNYGLDTSDDPGVFREVDKLVSAEIVSPKTKKLYEKKRIWIIKDLRERWTRRKTGEVTDIFSIWREIIEKRSLARELVKNRAGFEFLIEREMLYADMAKLPSYFGDLTQLVIKLREHIDDFDSEGLLKVTGKKLNMGHKALNSLQGHLGLASVQEPVETWRMIRVLRNGLAHPNPKGHRKVFIQSLEYFGLSLDMVYEQPKKTWVKISRAYLDSLRQLAEALRT